jgi:HTH-type transcriptional regulator / antitoxin HigA
MTQRNYAVAPGEFLLEWLEENGDHGPHWGVVELAHKLGVAPSYVMGLLCGEIAVSDPLAHALATLTGIPAKSWQAWEAMYQSDKARLGAEAGQQP